MKIGNTTEVHPYECTNLRANTHLLHFFTKKVTQIYVPHNAVISLNRKMVKNGNYFCTDPFLEVNFAEKQIYMFRPL